LNLATDPRLIALRDSLPGQVLRGSGRVQYYLRERIGEGGQGWVFTANWDEPGGFVVIAKVLRPDAVNADTMRRFQREADVLRMLSQSGTPNPHVVRFYDHATAVLKSPNGTDTYTLPFTILEYVNGLTLEQVIDAQPGRGLAVERARRILRQVSQALEIVHAKKVIHRDLKPSNILLALEAGTEVAKVTDFGLVKLVDMNMQRTATLAGASLGYAPPEQYEQGNQRVGERTDVFSLAAITFEILTGKMAFPYRDGENPLLIVTRILNETRPTLAKHAENLPQQLRERPDLVSVLDAHITRALSADPAARHASVTDFFGAIEPVLRTASEAGRGSAPPTRALPFSETIPASMQTPDVRPSQVPVIVPLSGERLSSLPSPPPQERMSFTPAPQQSGEVRIVRPHGDTSNPALWSWRVMTPRIQAEVIRAAAFAPDGETGVGVGARGLARWERGMWIAATLPSAFNAARVRTVARYANGDLALAGDGVAVRLSGGTLDVFPMPDPELVLLGALVEGDTVTLVGHRPDRTRLGATTATRIGCVVQFQGRRLAMLLDIPSSPPLRGIARVGSRLVACGERGAIVAIENGAIVGANSVCNGELNAIAGVSGGAVVTVGIGGHALALDPQLKGHLEAVQTTSDLLSLAVTSEGTVWAGATRARILRRTGDSWVRMSNEVGLSSAALAIVARPRLVRSICDDGAVIEGRLP
jgi:serine/threonine protein kinase